MKAIRPALYDIRRAFIRSCWQPWTSAQTNDVHRPAIMTSLLDILKETDLRLNFSDVLRIRGAVFMIRATR